MKKQLTVYSLLALLLGLCLVQSGFGQTTPKFYSLVYYHKIKPGHTFAEARAMENEFKKVHQYQANEGIISSWYMLALDMTTNPNKAYDYITINTFSDPGYIDNSYPNAVMEKVMGADYKTKTSDLYKRMQEIKEVAKFEIWDQIEWAAAIPMPSPDKAPVWVVTNMKVKSAQYEEYMAQAKKLKPVFQEQINMGGGAVGWNFAGLMYPWASETPYDFSSVFQYPNMKALLADNKGEAAFKKALPGVDAKQFFKELNALREPGRQEIYYLVEFAVKTASSQATK